MDIFDSFVKWLEGLFKPLINLYHEDSTTFFVGAIFAVLILLIIVIFLARRAEDDDMPSKKIKYDDIDWSTEDDNAKTETAAKTESAVKAEPASRSASRNRSSAPHSISGCRWRPRAICSASWWPR